MHTIKAQIHWLMSILFLLAGTGSVYAQEQSRGGPPLDAARIPRVEKPWTPAQRAILEPRERNGRVLGVWSTCAQAPELCNAWLTFTDYLLQDSSLPTRDRELLIMRIGWLNGGAYEWAAHTGLARSVGISDEELRRITRGPDALGWSAWDSSLLRAADELHANALISDATWNALAARYTRRQLMEAVFTVGQYNMVAMYLNTLGVQFEEGFEGFPAP
ncbi:MAG: carboxymuconolactone decarboxylase family protein [Pseudohongiella sp.]|nr:carboxymuconolactone decarboxylase family protein [Pseudohongiella sp.]